MSNLFSPLRAESIRLANRIVMAPMTRSRAGRSHVPNDLLVKYYSQRASAGLLITEATMAAADGCAFIGEAGLFDDACVTGWRRVTDAVHQRGGRIVVQLWHPGRAAHSSLNGGVQPISSTDRAIRHSTIHTLDGPRPYEVPRRLAHAELPGIVTLFANAAQRAHTAGFDGVQLHAAHGYLLDQFLRDSVNDRTDDYGGSIENRARLLIEVLDATIDVLGADRVSIRLSPLVSYNDIEDSNPSALARYLARECDLRRIAFLELRHDDHAAPAERLLAAEVRRNFYGALFLNGRFDLSSASAAVENRNADAVSFATLYLSNPDLVERFAAGTDLNSLDSRTIYGSGPQGYTDYPTLSQAPLMSPI